MPIYPQDILATQVDGDQEDQQSNPPMMAPRSTWEQTTLQVKMRQTLGLVVLL